MNGPSKVYRQLITGGQPLWYDTTKTPPVSSAAFIPSSQDTDGLSLIDCSSRSKVWAAHRVEAPTTTTYVAELEVSDIEKIATEAKLVHELSCDPDRLDTLFGLPISHWICWSVQANRGRCSASSSSLRRRPTKSSPYPTSSFSPASECTGLQFHMLCIQCTL